MATISRLESNIALHFAPPHPPFFISSWLVGLGLRSWHWVRDICGVWQIPYVKKVIVNCGVGEASQNAKALEGTIRDIALVTGQKSVVTRSRKAIAGFKLREGVPVGVTLTLRGEVCI